MIVKTLNLLDHLGGSFLRIVGYYRDKNAGSKS